MQVELHEHQTDALRKMHNGCILRGGVGSGKSITSIAYFFSRVMGGAISANGRGETKPFQNPEIDTLLIITPAKKRDGLEWEHECARFGLSKDPTISFGGIRVIVDSWNNIAKYTSLTTAFVIFDEQRLVGSGAWVKSFYLLAKNNPWILLSATPGDHWMDYIPVFVANGYYKNRTQFIDRHVVYHSHTTFPKVKGFLEEGHLHRISREVLVEMPFHRHTRRLLRTVPVEYDGDLYRRINKEEWNPWDDEPIENISQHMYLIRRAVNSHASRLTEFEKLHQKHPKLILFYNHTYELELLREYLTRRGETFSEWNGQKHQEIPDGDRWVYLVQYTAGSDAWNCVTTDSMLFYSLQYSYRTFEQCQGRIDRLNTPFTDLYYYILRSVAPIDQAIWKALAKKENFNEKTFRKDHGLVA